MLKIKTAFKTIRQKKEVIIMQRLVIIYFIVSIFVGTFMFGEYDIKTEFRAAFGWPWLAIKTTAKFLASL